MSRSKKVNITKMVIQRINNSNGSSMIYHLNSGSYSVRVEAFGSVNCKKILNSAPLWGNDSSELYLFSLVRKCDSRNHSLGVLQYFKREKRQNEYKAQSRNKKRL